LTEIRPSSSDELEAVFEAMTGPFGFDMPDGEDFDQWIERARQFYDPARIRLADVDGTIAGTLVTFSLRMSVPGAILPVAGTSGVTVRTSHRRQGLLRGMMRAHLEDVAEHEEVAATLWASDSAIYGRFGFGMASYDTRVDIERTHVDFHRLAPTSAPVVECDRNDIAEPARTVYGEQLLSVPGMIDRTDLWWQERTFADRPANRGGATKARYAVATDGDVPVGCAKYRIKDRDDDSGRPSQDVIVVALHAVTPEGWAGIWRHVLSHDFGATIRAHHRPIDDPIHSMLGGSRRARTVRSDGLWVRVMDVARMFEARSYLDDGRIRFRVIDGEGFIEGAYQLTVEDGSGSVARSSEPEIVLDAEDLGAISMGGRSTVELVRSGRASGPVDAAVRMDRMLGWHSAPWCPEVF